METGVRRGNLERCAEGRETEEGEVGAEPWDVALHSGSTGEEMENHWGSPPSSPLLRAGQSVAECSPAPSRARTTIGDPGPCPWGWGATSPACPGTRRLAARIRQHSCLQPARRQGRGLAVMGGTQPPPGPSGPAPSQGL